MDRSLRQELAALACLFLLPGLAFAAGTLDRVKQSGKLTLGYRADARPFSYRDDSGNPAGYSIALCRKVAEELKADVNFVQVSVEDRFTALQQGKIDLLCDPATETLARRSLAAFSIPVLASGTGALVRRDAPGRLKEVLSGRKVSGPIWRGSAYQILEKRVFTVVGGTTGERWVKERRDELGLNVSVAPVKDYSTGLQRVIERDADALFGDRAILLDAAKRSPLARDLAVVDRYFTRESVALALQRSDEDFRLAVDRALSRLFRSKDIGPLYETYFGKPDEGALNFFALTALPE
jgi:polar amino acid transport system substrate-binding protein